MSQIAVTNSSKRLTNAAIEFAVAACNAQVIECAAVWGIDPTPVAFYARAEDLPVVECRIMDIVDDLGEPGALGFHDSQLGVIYGRVLAQSVADTSVTLSHECLEELVDPTCDAWRDFGNGQQVALEVADACEADSYAVQATVLGETRDVMLSNYVLPAWFERGSAGPWDRMHTLSAPLSMSPGGYLILRNADGHVFNVFARRRDVPCPPPTFARKLTNPTSRTLRRLRGARK